MPLHPNRHLPRLAPAAYRGFVLVHWTMAIANRGQGWLTADFHANLRGLLHRSGLGYATVVPAYCLMPDHLHLLSAGVANEADARAWARAVRRAMGPRLAPFALQKQAYDHVLRPRERGRDAFASLVAYVVANPVRANLRADAGAWAFTGACVPEVPGLDPRDPAFSDRWWAYWNKCSRV